MVGSNLIRRIFNLQKSSRSDIVARLLEQKAISPEEATVLLDKSPVYHITVGRIDVSSGARIIGGNNLEQNK